MILSMIQFDKGITDKCDNILWCLKPYKSLQKRWLSSWIYYNVHKSPHTYFHIGVKLSFFALIFFFVLLISMIIEQETRAERCACMRRLEMEEGKKGLTLSQLTIILRFFVFIKLYVIWIPNSSSSGRFPSIYAAIYINEI